MVDDTQNPEEQPVVLDPEAPVADHPHAGVASEGYSSPQADVSGQGISGTACMIGKIVLKRGGAETDIEFPINPPAVIGRFDPDIGPVDVDLGTLPEGSYVSRRHASITCDEGRWRLCDLGSSNGTFLLRSEFERVEEGELEDGSEFALGNARFVFRSTSDAIHSADPQS